MAKALINQKQSFASFWAGESLSPYEQACLRSFTLRGHEVILFSYDEVRNAPEGVVLGDARSIVDQRLVSAYLIGGKPSLSHFSDIFRYWLFRNTGAIWIDSDMLLLRDFDKELPKVVLAKEDQSSLCGAIMRLDSTDPMLDSLIRYTESLAGKELIWGQTGPRLLTSAFGKDSLFQVAFEPPIFFPIHFDDFWKPLLPAYRDECEALCKDSYAAHLWNNILVKLGLWKDKLPPLGSFLHERFKLDGSDIYFNGTYPADAMHHMVENWRMRYSGKDLAFGPLLRQVVPSMAITAQKRIKDLRLSLKKPRNL